MYKRCIGRYIICTYVHPIGLFNTLLFLWPLRGNIVKPLNENSVKLFTKLGFVKTNA